MLVRYTLEEPDKAIFRLMCEILFPGESTEERLKDLKESVWLDSSEPPVWARAANSGPGKDPIWRDRTPSSNAIVLGYYDHVSRTVVLFDRVIKRVETEDDLGKRFRIGTLFRVVLAHELAHWLTWSYTSFLETELSETLAELVSWAAFSMLPEGNGRDAALGCQHWLNEEAPKHWYRTYWLWLVLCGFTRAGNSVWNLNGDFKFLHRMLVCSQRNGHQSFQRSLTLALNEITSFNSSSDEIPLEIKNPWITTLEGYQEAFDRLMRERESAFRVGREGLCGDDVQTACDILSI